jgi:hypothetical protein
MSGIRVLIESGEKKTFTSAIDWPGWSRSGANEKYALETLAAYSSRYARAINNSHIKFLPPQAAGDFDIIERLPGDKTTDFGVPSALATAENAPLEATELKRLEALLKAVWEYFGAIIQANAGKTLRKGPRGGGRTLEKIIGHVLDAHYQAYLPKIYWREKIIPEPDAATMIKKLEAIDGKALALAVSGRMPAAGPHGGKLWTPRYFIRRAAWHILDHAWEIEDKAES